MARDEKQGGSVPAPQAKTDAAGKPANGLSAGRRERVYKGTQEVDHDLFKLEAAKMSKNVSYTDIPNVQQFVHNHIFHTVDSSGKKQTTCTPVGGHFHEVEVTLGEGGVPELTVGPPKKWVIKKKRGVKTKVAVPVGWGSEDDREYDEHTHDATYIGSERIQLRAANVEFAKYDAEVRGKQSPAIDGVRVGK